MDLTNIIRVALPEVAVKKIHPTPKTKYVIQRLQNDRASRLNPGSNR